MPGADDPWAEPAFAGCHRLNGNGELTGLEWVRESGLLTTVVGLTNTHSVGVVRDALIAAAVDTVSPDEQRWYLPVVGETYDGDLNDINGMHVRAEHVHAALASAEGGPVAEGGVGSGTGMMCHGFKGGIGTASRVVDGSTVGVLVQANHGRRERLRVNGVPVGPLPGEEPAAGNGAGPERLDHRDRCDRRHAPARPVRPSGPARGARYRARRWRGRALVRRPHPGVRDR